MDWSGMGIGLGITFAFIAMGLTWQARRRGHLLLDTGVLGEPLFSRNPVTLLPLAILLVGVWLWKGSEGLMVMVLALAGLLVMVVVMKKRIHLRFTDQGICFVRFIKWGEIRSYSWDKNSEGGEDLGLHVSMKGRESNISYPIPAMHRERVAEILAAHVPRGS